MKPSKITKTKEWKLLWDLCEESLAENAGTLYEEQLLRAHALHYFEKGYWPLFPLYDLDSWTQQRIKAFEVDVMYRLKLRWI
jgi:hypothetical protein